MAWPHLPWLASHLHHSFFLLWWWLWLLLSPGLAGGKHTLHCDVPHLHFRPFRTSGKDLALGGHLAPGSVGRSSTCPSGSSQHAHLLSSPLAGRRGMGMECQHPSVGEPGREDGSTGQGGHSTKWRVGSLPILPRGVQSAQEHQLLPLGLWVLPDRCAPLCPLTALPGVRPVAEDRLTCRD